MDFKEIVGKALRGEDYSADVKDFTPEQSIKFNLELKTAADAEAKENIAKAVATRKEKERAEASATQRMVETLKAENARKAVQKFVSEFGIKPEEQGYYSDLASKSESMDTDVILGQLKSAHVAKNPDEFINKARQFEKMQKEAEEFNKSQAGGSYIPGSPEDSKYSEADKALVAAWKKQGMSGTLEEANRINTQGLVRKL